MLTTPLSLQMSTTHRVRGNETTVATAICPQLLRRRGWELLSLEGVALSGPLKR